MPRSLLSLLIVSFLASTAVAQDNYLRGIKPVLRERCYGCHGAAKQEAGLRLDTVEAMLRGGDSGPIVEPGKATESRLWEKVTASDPSERMPPEGSPLTAEQLAALETWIQTGSPAPADERPDELPENHWAFRPPVRPAVPQEVTDWGHNPIDAFIAVGHRKHGLTAVGAARPEVLLRRVYLDLTGLPPTPEQLDAFLADPSEAAYRDVVNRLLDSPQYGERWGRHWMDVWRYSDWYGRRAVPDVLNSYAQIFRWRDWIVESLNQDKGYDRMVMEMLAADEIRGDDDSAVPATGFLVRNFYRWNYHTWMKDNIEHTAKAFLGLSLNCCQCHDHKYDPITQEEYFKFRAFFEPLELRQDRVAGEPDPGMYPKYSYGAAYAPITSGMIRVFDEKLDAQTFMYERGDERNVVKDKPAIPPGVPAALGGHFQVEAVALPAMAWYPGLKKSIRDEEQSKLTTALSQAQEQLRSATERREQQQSQFVAARDAASAALQQALDQAKVAGLAIPPLNGRRSLLLNAEQGRRLLAYRFSSAPTNDIDISFQLQLVTDTHTNFQLSKSVAQGLTAAFVAFEGGKIMTYEPGSTTPVQKGSYDFAAGENRFLVRMALVPQENIFRLTISRASDGHVLVDGIPAALNDWNPSLNSDNGLFVDARPGSIVLYDDLAISRHTDGSTASIDFESNLYADDRDVVGIEGWEDTSFSAAPGYSVASLSLLRGADLTKAKLDLEIASAAVEELDLAVKASEAQVAAAQAQLASLAARITADDARYVQRAADADLKPLILAAVRAERAASLATAEYEAVSAARSLCAVISRPPDNTERTTDLPIAQKVRDTAQATLATARTQASAPEEGVEYTPLSSKFPDHSTGRRSALARWIVARDNPLAARVAANHIWLRHFGRGLVTTPENFGRSGNPPSHPELLDWLAVELMEHGWQMKHIHRLIVTSGVYRMTSEVSADNPNWSLDRDNVQLWRRLPQRLETESIRDTMLFVAGELDLQIGGREIEQNSASESRRRSLYISHHGETKFELLDLFDAANPCDCYQRTSSVRPQQALALMNSELAAGLGRSLAQHVWKEVHGGSTSIDESNQRFVESLFKRLFSRVPLEEERAACLDFLNEQTALLTRTDLSAQVAAPPIGLAPATDPAQRAREGLSQALFSHSDFITVR